jgi:phosphate transport system protein
LVIRQNFEHELDLLRQDLLKMGSKVETSVRDAMKAVFDRDNDLADTVIASDDEIDALDLDIEQKCMKLLALQQPMARDLRTIGSIFKITTDLERIADHAVDIAKIARILNSMPPFKPYEHIPKLLDMVQGMLHRCIEAFVNRDLDLVKEMCAKDDEVDAKYKFIFSEVMGIMESNPSIIKQGVYTISILRFLERIADHATNVGERTVYMETGVLEELNI